MDNATCIRKYEVESLELSQNESLFCPSVFDTYLCWPPTRNGQNVSQRCPDGKALDATKFAWRTCNPDGTWYDNNDPKLRGRGYTYYDGCFKPELQDLLLWCKRMGRESCDSIVNITRHIEMIGLSLSFIALILSLIIFCKYQILRNNRTTMHKHLFIATLFQVFVRLILYSDQQFKNIENVPYLCESGHVLLEFSKTATIMWMFIEGLSLHNAMTVAVFKEYTFIKIYCFAGWLASALLTFAWVVAMAFSETEQCWYLYNFHAIYWILEGPTSALIMINILFLLNIMRILVMKLRDSNMGEIEQIRKAFRAAILLVPLMGTVNVLFMIDYRIFDSAWKFALWSFPTYFLTSFQGFFIATLYCFMNGEVREVIKNSFSMYMSLRSGGIQNVAATNHLRHSGEESRLSTVDPDI